MVFERQFHQKHKKHKNSIIENIVKHN
jgi:hypothetical protein